MFKPYHTAEEMFDAVDAASNQNDDGVKAAKADAIAFVGALINGSMSPEEVQTNIDLNADPGNEWYTPQYAHAFSQAWDSLYAKLTV